MENLELAIVDVETTGTSAAYDRIIEVALIRVCRGRLAEEFSTLIDPERIIPPYIEHLTGIRNRDLKGAPTFRAIKDRLGELLDGCVLVAHNARFDYAFLKNEFERHHHPFSAHCLCTARLSRILFPDYRRHNLDSIIARFGIPCANRHRALDDARVLWDFLGVTKERIGEGELKEAVSRILTRPVFPPLLDESLVQALPESMGVYIFYGERGEPLYVGRSVNIRSRVINHFLDGRQPLKETGRRQQIADVKAHKTAGELGARLLESALIHELSPLYNRKPPAKHRHTRASRAWPFPGPLMIEEKDRDHGGGEAFIVDQWSIVGRYRYDDCGVTDVSDADAADYACRAALAAYLRQPRRSAVRQISPQELEKIKKQYGAKR